VRNFYVTAPTGKVYQISAETMMEEDGFLTFRNEVNGKVIYIAIFKEFSHCIEAVE